MVKKAETRFDEVLPAIQALQDTCEDHVSSPTTMRVSLNDDTGFPFRLDYRNGGPNVALLDPFAAHQLGRSVITKENPPLGFYDRDLYRRESVDALNHGLSTATKNLNVRTIRPELAERREHPIVRGFTSPTYGDVKPTDIVEIGRMMERESGEEFLGKVEFDNLLRRTDAEFKSGKIVIGEEVFRALSRIAAGHVGQKSVSGDAGLWRQWCENGAMAPMAGMETGSMTLVHRGDMHVKFTEFVQNILMHTRNAPQWAAALMGSKEWAIPTVPDEDEILMTFLGSRQTRALLMDLGHDPKERPKPIRGNVFDLVDTVTRWTKALPWDRRTEVERNVGGYLISRAEREEEPTAV